MCAPPPATTTTVPAAAATTTTRPPAPTTTTSVTTTTTTTQPTTTIPVVVEQAIPPSTPDLIVTLAPGEAIGLYRTIRALAINGPDQKEVAAGGHLVRVHTNTTFCPPVGDPWNQPWSCETHVAGTFQLRNKFHQGTGVNGGNVDIEFNAAGDLIRFHELVHYTWNPATRSLRMGVTYPGSDRTNFTRNWGHYNIRGTSTAQIHTETANESAGFSFDSGSGVFFDASVEKTSFAKLAFVRVLLNGNPYWANEGIVEVKRDGAGTTTFGTGMDWFTDALVDYSDRVDAYSAECSGQSKHSGSFSLKFLNNGVDALPRSGAIGFAQGSTATCRMWSDSLASRLRFVATSAQDGLVGEQFRSQIRIRDRHNGTCLRQYDAAFTAAVNWSLQLTTSGGQTISGFDLGSSAAIWNQPTAPSFVAVYPCTLATATDFAVISAPEEALASPTGFFPTPEAPVLVQP